MNISRGAVDVASAGWETDLWGRLRRQIENARALADVSADDLAFAKLSIQGQLVSAYLQLREADAELRLVADTVTAYARALQIAQNRYAAGVAVKTDVLQAQTQLANAQDQATALTLQRAQLEHAIAALVGNAASDFTLAALSARRALVTIAVSRQTAAVALIAALGGGWNPPTVR